MWIVMNVNNIVITMVLVLGWQYSTTTVCKVLAWRIQKQMSILVTCIKILVHLIGQCHTRTPQISVLCTCILLQQLISVHFEYG